ncbi:glycosyltransferase family 4 protein [Gemmatimonadota bacterium DH-20]|uniref:Glycosyltransferase family 4 protein n=1 Tax=Gaopeijia maritima TaxID=3119007 RepID=A0ABU9E607_9BACT
MLLRSYHLVRELAVRNDLDLVAFTQRNLLSPIYADVDQGLEEAREHLSDYCRSVAFVPLPSDRSRWGRHALALRSLVTGSAYDLEWLTSPAYRAAVEAKIARNIYDVVHVDTVGLMQYADLVPRGVPIVLDHHNVESHMLERRAGRTSGWRRAFFTLQARRVRALEERWCETVALNAVCSEMDAERLTEIAPHAPVEVVPNGVDIEFFKPSSGRKRERRIIFVGTLDWYPNTEAVRRIAHHIWPLLRDRDPEMHCDIIGGSPPEDLVELAARDDRFHVHGFVDDIHPWLEQALAYVCPIRDGGGTKLKILDALAMSKAIVADPIACEGIDVTDGTNVLFATEPDAYVEAILRLRDDDELRDQLEENARRLAVERYSFRAVGDDFSRSLRALASA